MRGRCVLDHHDDRLIFGELAHTLRVKLERLGGVNEERPSGVNRPEEHRSIPESVRQPEVRLGVDVRSRESRDTNSSCLIRTTQMPQAPKGSSEATV